jgi:hypothetical protein
MKHIKLLAQIFYFTIISVPACAVLLLLIELKSAGSAFGVWFIMVINKGSALLCTAFLLPIRQKNIITILMVIFIPLVLTAQSKCNRVSVFTADCIFGGGNNKLHGALNIGVSGGSFTAQKKNTGISIMAGVKMYDDVRAQRAPSSNPQINVIPTATLLLKQRFNGAESKLVHAIGFTAGGNDFLEASYRIYAAPKSNSFATVGGVLGYSNKQGITIGFIIMGLF